MATLRQRKRKLKNGVAAYWIVDFSLSEGGKTRRAQEHFRVDPTNPQEARLLAEQRKAEVERKIATQKLRNRAGALDAGPANVEIADWLDAFARAVQPNCCKEYHRDIVRCCNRFWALVAEQGAFTTAHLRRQHFADFAEAMQRKGNKPKSIHNDLSIIKRAVRWGIDEGYLEPALVRAFPSVKVPRKKRRALSKDEIEELLSAVEDTAIYEPVLVALYTGARRTELVQLRCSDVDLEHGVLHFRADISKAGEHGDVPIHDRIRPLLNERAQGDGYLFVHLNGHQWNPNTLSRRFTALVRDRLGWQDVTFHCLRHTFGTQLAASGKVSPFELQRLMRHKNITTSMIYVNLAKQELPDVNVF